MLVLLLALLCVNVANTQVRSVCNNPPLQADTIRYTFLKKHNELRRDLAKGTLDALKGTFRGSTSLFAMNYDCDLEIDALMAVKGCPNQVSSADGTSMNYKTERGNYLSDDGKVVDEIGQVFEDWSYTRFDGTLDQETVIYDDETIEPFANIIYNKSISLACVATYCDSTKKRAYACVYSSSPKRGEPLYLPGPKAKGCTKNACTKAIEGSTCLTDTDSTDTFPAGLCRTKELVVP
ncbi:SCP-like protein, partial [Necator americanus]